MKSRFRREFYDFLIQDGISLECGIIPESIYKMAGVEALKANEEISDSFFDFSFPRRTRNSEKNAHPEDEIITVLLPSVNLKQLYAYLDFFKIPYEDFKTRTELKLSEAFINDIIPEFKRYYKTLDAEVIAKYKIKSKGILESSAVSTLREYTDKVIDTILADSTLVTANTTEMIDAMLLLGAKVKGLSDQPIFYQSIIDTDVTKHIKCLEENDKNKNLLKQLKLVGEGIDLFSRYHRYRSVIANETFFKEKNTFLENFKIVTKHCDVIEDTLLALANAKLGAEGKSSFSIGHSRSRLVFKFTDIDKENFGKLISFCQKAGDETVIEGDGYGSYGSSIPMGANESCTLITHDDERAAKKAKVIECHSLEVDGEVFYQKIYPLLKDKIAAMVEQKSKIIEAYQEKSKPYFDEIEKQKEAEIASNLRIYTLFQAGKNNNTNDNNLEKMEVDNTTSMLQNG